MSALTYLLPEEWTSTFRPLQDKCPPSPLSEVEALLREEIGEIQLSPIPIGVASLAQVHVAQLVKSPESTHTSHTMPDKVTVAVKIQHPSLDEFAKIDIKTVGLIVKTIKWAFPEFEFDWLAEEMKESLPKELDFREEAQNAAHLQSLFRQSGRALKVPMVYQATRRVLLMECNLPPLFYHLMTNLTGDGRY